MGRSLGRAVFITRFIITVTIVTVRVSAQVRHQACARLASALARHCLRSTLSHKTLATIQCRNPMCQIGGLACVAIRFLSDAVSRSLRIQIWILTAVGDSVTDLPPFSRVTSGWLTSGYSQFASARTHPPHCRQEAAVPPRAVRGCPPRLPCRARAPSPSTCISQPGDACSSRRISTPNHKTERRDAADARTMRLELQKRIRRSAAVTNHSSLACRVVADNPCH